MSIYQSKYTFCMHTRTTRKRFRLQKQTFSIWRPCWRPYWISRFAIIYANLCRQFQYMTHLVVQGVRVHNFSVLKVTLPYGNFHEWSKSISHTRIVILCLLYTLNSALRHDNASRFHPFPFNFTRKQGLADDLHKSQALLSWDNWGYAFHVIHLHSRRFTWNFKAWHFKIIFSESAKI